MIKVVMEEKKILEAFSQGNMKSAPYLENELARYRRYAKSSLDRKNRPIQYYG